MSNFVYKNPRRAFSVGNVVSTGAVGLEPTTNGSETAAPLLSYAPIAENRNFRQEHLHRLRNLALPGHTPCGVLT